MEWQLLNGLTLFIVFIKCFYSSIPTLPTEGTSGGKPGIAGNKNVKYRRALCWIRGPRPQTAWHSMKARMLKGCSGGGMGFCLPLELIFSSLTAFDEQASPPGALFPRHSPTSPMGFHSKDSLPPRKSRTLPPSGMSFSKSQSASLIHTAQYSTLH